MTRRRRRTPVAAITAPSVPARGASDRKDAGEQPAHHRADDAPRGSGCASPHANGRIIWTTDVPIRRSAGGRASSATMARRQKPTPGSARGLRPRGRYDHAGRLAYGSASWDTSSIPARILAVFRPSRVHARLVVFEVALSSSASFLLVLHLATPTRRGRRSASIRARAVSRGSIVAVPHAGPFCVAAGGPGGSNPSPPNPPTTDVKKRPGAPVSQQRSGSRIAAACQLRHIHRALQACVLACGFPSVIRIYQKNYKRMFVFVHRVA